VARTPKTLPEERERHKTALCRALDLSIARTRSKLDGIELRRQDRQSRCQDTTTEAILTRNANIYLQQIEHERELIASLYDQVQAGIDIVNSGGYRNLEPLADWAEDALNLINTITTTEHHTP